MEIEYYRTGGGLEMDIIATDQRDSQQLPPHWLAADALRNHDGYPEPFLKRDIHFSHRWQTLRLEQLAREDIRVDVIVMCIYALAYTH